MRISRQPTVQSETVLETRQGSTNIWEAKAGRFLHSRLDTYQNLVSENKIVGWSSFIFVIIMFRRLRQEDCHTLEANLSFTRRHCLKKWHREKGTKNNCHSFLKPNSCSEVLENISSSAYLYWMEVLGGLVVVWNYYFQDLSHSTQMLYPWGNAPCPWIHEKC